MTRDEMKSWFGREPTDLEFAAAQVGEQASGPFRRPDPAPVRQALAEARMPTRWLAAGVTPEEATAANLPDTGDTRFRRQAAREIIALKLRKAGLECATPDEERFAALLDATY